MASTKVAKKTQGSTGKFKGFSEGERAAMKARAQELKAESKQGSRKSGANGEADVLSAIAKMPGPYKAMGERLHKIIKESAPMLTPKTWYGLPAYAKDGKVVCYLRMNPKPPFGDRFMNLGFNESAKLDDGSFWPIMFALTKLTPVEEKKIAVLVKRATS